MQCIFKNISRLWTKQDNFLVEVWSLTYDYWICHLERSKIFVLIFVIYLNNALIRCLWRSCRNKQMCQCGGGEVVNRPYCVLLFDLVYWITGKINIDKEKKLFIILVITFLYLDFEPLSSLDTTCINYTGTTSVYSLWPPPSHHIAAVLVPLFKILLCPCIDFCHYLMIFFVQMLPNILSEN